MGGFAYIRSIIGIVLARPKHNKRPALRQIMASDSLIYNASVFISQLDRCFVVHFRVIAAAEVAHTERHSVISGKLD